MPEKKKKSGQFPLTGLLTVLIIIQFICVVGLACVVIRREHSRREGQTARNEQMTAGGREGSGRGTKDNRLTAETETMEAQNAEIPIMPVTEAQTLKIPIMTDAEMPASPGEEEKTLAGNSAQPEGKTPAGNSAQPEGKIPTGNSAETEGETPTGNSAKAEGKTLTGNSAKAEGKTPTGNFAETKKETPSGNPAETGGETSLDGNPGGTDTEEQKNRTPDDRNTEGQTDGFFAETDTGTQTVRASAGKNAKGQTAGISAGTDTEGQTAGAGDRKGETSADLPEAVTEGQTSDIPVMTLAELQTEEETEPEEKLVVAIDPGHQGSWVDMSALEPSAPGSQEMKAKSTTGTEGRFSGKPEYELNLEISLLLRTELEKRGYEVILTREDNDTAISNSERALKAYDEGGDIYVRIHANGSEDSSVKGALAMVPSPSNPYVSDLAEDSQLLGECILNAYCETAGFASQGVQYYDNMTGINWSRLPVIILEMGFMTNSEDDLRMADPAVQERMADGIANGIDSYFLQKGMKAQSRAAASEEAQAEMSALLERLAVGQIAPAENQGEHWAVSLADLGTGAEGDIHGDVQMKSASVIKVFLMAAIYDRVCYPSSEDRHISVGEAYEGELKQLITDMITVSDNSAANTLLEKLGGGDAQAGMAVVNQFCRENGYTATTMGRRFLEENPSGDNYTSANDCRRLLQSIYTGSCVNREASAKMFAYLQNQTRRNKIPSGTPETIAVSNKTGELGGEYGDYVENDIAVLERGGSAYILCVLSENLQDNGAAIGRIQSIAATVCEQW